MDNADSFDREVDEVVRIVPDDYGRNYDMHEIIRLLVDEGRFYELKDG